MGFSASISFRFSKYPRGWLLEYRVIVCLVYKKISAVLFFQSSCTIYISTSSVCLCVIQAKRWWFYFLLLCERRSFVSDSLQPHGLYSPWNSPGQNTGVGNLSLLQGIFPTQGSNPGLPHCGWILYQVNLKGSPRILEWVAYPFFRGSSQPRN